MDENNEIKEFLKTNEKSHFLQSPEWTKVKTEWENEFIVIRDEKGNITGTMSILLRKVPVFKRYIMYAPRGFVCNIDDKETLKKMTEEVKKIAKKYNAFIFRLDPDISNENTEFKDIMINLGYKFKKKIKNIDQVVQPKYVFRLSLKDKTEEELLKSFNEKTRYNVRLATRKGVKVVEGTIEDLPAFYDIMKKTGSRDNFFIRPISYFEKVFKELSPEHAKLLFAEYEGEKIAGVMPIMYGNKVWYLYGGSSNEHRNLMPNYLLQYEMMKWGLKENCETYDFRGVSGFKDPKDPAYGVYKFKKGFNGEFVEFVNELYMVFDPFINTMFNISQWLYIKYLIIKDKLKRK